MAARRLKDCQVWQGHPCRQPRRADLKRFAKERGLTIAAWYVENESGAKLARPKLFRLLEDCEPDDVLLIEQVDWLSRLNEADWKRLRAELNAREVRVVALDLPTSWQMLTATDEFTSRMHEAMNGMMLDMLAAIARKDYTDRRRRQRQGIERAQAEGKYAGRPENTERNKALTSMLKAGQSWSSIIAATGASRSALARLRKGIS